MRARAQAEPTRVTVICPQNDPSDSWVVDQADVESETRRRLDATLAALNAAGVQATGQVVAADPYTAVLDVVESDDPPAEIIVSTLPRTRSGWMRRDLIERLRDRVDVPISHVEADTRTDPAESR